jgi:glycosyltransferase involved in cell wall biosynthesis
MIRICILPRVEGTGGGATFRNKFEAGLNARGFEVTHDPDQAESALLVLAGTKGLVPLWRAKRRGVRIVQRLDGINWIHRKRDTGWRHFIRAEYGNFILAFIRRFLADRILYQSEFSKNWWEDWYGEAAAPASIVHNGVDLELYSPDVGRIANPPYRLLVVEGSLGGGYDMGLDHAVRLAETLAEEHNLPMQLVMVGKVESAHRARVEAGTRVPIEWVGVVPRERIPEMDRSAHLFFSADINAACPNAVIEALACGLPVVAFDTGALKELVIGNSGRLVPYGGNVWNLDRPDVLSLGAAAAEILRDLPRFRSAARAHAESALGLDKMVDEYLKVLLED